MRKKVLLLGAAYGTVGVILIILSFFIGRPKGELGIKIKTASCVMPMAYKVYGNPEVENGKYYLAKVIFENTGKASIKNLQISYRVPDYIDWTTPQTYSEILPGQTTVDMFYPKFPQKILNVLNETTSSIEIKIKYNDGRGEKEEIKRANFQIRGRNELVYTDIPEEEVNDIRDMYRNVNLLACFVTPEDPVIKYFTQQLQQKVLKGTIAGVANNPKEILRFMEAIYDFEVAEGLVYGGTLGLPEKINGHYSMVQHIRLPREVITGGAGLCVELSTLFCSIALSAGLQCGIFVTSQHAFPAIIAGNQVIPLEATGIGGEGIGGRMDFKKALNTGMKEMQLFSQGYPSQIGTPIAFLNIGMLQGQGLRPPDLQDDFNLRKKIDELFKKVEQLRGYNRGTSRTNYGRNQNNYAPPAPRGNYIQYTDPNGLFSFSYPQGWQTAPYPNPYLPYLVVLAAPPTMDRDVEVYVLNGVASPQQAFMQIYNALIQMGTQIQYQPAGTVTIGRRNYMRFAGMSTNRYGTVYWTGYFTTSSAGVVGFVIGSKSSNLSSPDLVTIKNSFRVMR